MNSKQLNELLKKYKDVCYTNYLDHRVIYHSWAYKSTISNSYRTKT